MTYVIPSTPPANNQESYGRIVAYFSQPGAVLARSGAGMQICQYRTAEGRGCAVGCQFPNSFYDPDWDSYHEGTGFKVIADAFPDFAEFFKNVDPEFLRVAQGLHDNRATSAEHFLYELRKAVLAHPGWNINP